MAAFLDVSKPFDRVETRKRKNRGGDPKGEVEEKSSEKTRADRLRKRRGESQSFLLGDADQESETRMRKNALRTGRRQAVDNTPGNGVKISIRNSDHCSVFRSELIAISGALDHALDSYKDSI
ncbi:hypothetical protein TNCV_128011 [Trichonephila clavipes]|nr:hypothetical protein TNCV_128011 [Trichonephila clavipes]